MADAGVVRLKPSDLPSGCLVSVSVSFVSVRGSPLTAIGQPWTRRMALDGHPWMVVLRTEKRKVGSSILPLTTTTSHQRRRPAHDHDWGVSSTEGFQFGSYLSRPAARCS
jgi:hypothetical protein